MCSIKEQIEEHLYNWCIKTVIKYPWLVIKYEFNSNQKVFLVSFSGNKLYTNDFCNYCLKYYDKVIEQFGNNAPLFTDNEKLFKLNSPIVINFKKYGIY